MGLVFKMYGIDPKLELADPNFADDEVLEVVDQYISNCEKYHIPPDPSVLISLGTGWNVLKPTSKFTEGHLLSLFDILCENTHVTHLGSPPSLPPRVDIPPHQSSCERRQESGEKCCL